MSSRRPPRFRASIADGETPDRELNPPCRRKRVFLLYHWAPTARRASILKHGLRVRQPNACHSSGHLSDYLCFADWPYYAWTLSGGFIDQPGDWDLWTVRSNRVGRITYRSDHRGKTPAELRTWQDIPADALVYLATRTHTKKRKRRKAKA